MLLKTHTTLFSLCLFTGALFLFSPTAFTQTQVSRYVIGSTGNYSTGGNINLSSTVGEPSTATVSGGASILTQGFQQPSVVAGMTLQLQVDGYNATCSGMKDGFAVVNVLNGTAPFDFSWSPDGGSTMGGGIVDTSGFIAPGNYTVFVIDAQGNSGMASVTIDAERTDCGLVIYSGITPNSNNQNDLWIVDGIELYPENDVMIFNRWGAKVWSGTNYDNFNVVWDGKSSEGNDLPDGTYFYILNIPALQTFKGWVQITR